VLNDILAEMQKPPLPEPDPSPDPDPDPDPNPDPSPDPDPDPDPDPSPDPDPDPEPGPAQFPARPVPEFGIPESGEPGDGELSPVEQLQVRITETLDSVTLAAETVFPFGISKMLPNIEASGGGCQDIHLSMLGTSQSLGWCGSPIEQFFSTAGRAMMIVLCMTGFYFAAARTVAWS
jgi:hypothetical protein